MDRLDYLKRLPVITKADVKKIIACKNDYAYTYLNRLYKKGTIRQVIKGKYSASSDIFAIASSIHYPCYISYWACSYLKGYTEQIINTIQLACTKSYRKIQFMNYTIEFHRMNQNLFFGYEKKKFGDSFIFLADDEKLLIDCLLYQENIGNMDEMVKIVKNMTINQSKIISYLKRADNLALNRRVGFLLERIRGIDLSDKLRFQDGNYTQLSIFSRNHILDKKWMVKHDLS